MGEEPKAKKVRKEQRGPGRLPVTQREPEGRLSGSVLLRRLVTEQAGDRLTAVTGSPQTQ